MLQLWQKIYIICEPNSTVLYLRLGQGFDDDGGAHYFKLQSLQIH